MPQLIPQLNPQLTYQMQDRLSWTRQLMPQQNSLAGWKECGNHSGLKFLWPIQLPLCKHSRTAAPGWWQGQKLPWSALMAHPHLTAGLLRPCSALCYRSRGREQIKMASASPWSGYCWVYTPSAPRAVHCSLSPKTQAMDGTRLYLQTTQVCLCRASLSSWPSSSHSWLKEINLVTPPPSLKEQ